MKEKNRFFNKGMVIYTTICVAAILFIGCVFLKMENIDKSTILKSNTALQNEESIDKLFKNEDISEDNSSKKQYSAEVFGRIDINTAKKEDLMLLPGIGEVKADAIITYRTKTPFKKIEDLMNIKGIGEKTFDKIKESICVN